MQLKNRPWYRQSRPPKLIHSCNQLEQQGEPSFLSSAEKAESHENRGRNRQYFHLDNQHLNGGNCELRTLRNLARRDPPSIQNNGENIIAPSSLLQDSWTQEWLAKFKNTPLTPPSKTQDKVVLIFCAHSTVVLCESFDQPHHSDKICGII